MVKNVINSRNSVSFSQFSFYSCGFRLCVCLCVCLSVCVHDNSKNNGSIHLKLEHIVVYENSSDEFDIGHCPIKVTPKIFPSKNVFNLRLNAAIVDMHLSARLLTGVKHCYFTTGKSPLFVLFIFIYSIVHHITYFWLLQVAPILWYYID